MSDNKIFWSKTAKFYNKFTRGKKTYNTAYTSLEDHITAELNNNMLVLEIAAGPGTLSNRIADSCKHLTITDFSEQMIREAQKNVIKNTVSFEIADATNLQFKNNSFDAIIIANALHIMPDPQKAINEIKKVIKKDGVILCPTFTRENIKSKFKEHILEKVGFKTYSKWTNSSYSTFLIENDLEIIKQDTIYGYNFPICFVVCKKKKI